WVKSVTSKPVVTVGRFTSPDTMVSQVKRGVTDFIGAARPSIADPFLPRKIEEGRLEEIRECIGCNICYSGDSIGVPIRCTQNPTMGEEWRRGWHPEFQQDTPEEGSVLVVGAGPAGLEAARALGKRGYQVMLAEAGREIGGRVTREAALPGMSEYIRVRDYREQTLGAMLNVDIFRESKMTPEDVFATEPDHVAIATGSTWRRQCFDGEGFYDIATGDAALRVFTPDDIMDGKLPDGPTLIFDQDNYYMGGVIAERIRQEGHAVAYVTEDDSVSSWAGKTSERWRVRTHMTKLGITIETAHSLTGFDGAMATIECGYGGGARQVPVKNVVLVTSRAPNDQLYHDILAHAGGDPLPFTLTRIGDAEAPAIIAAAVYAGHRYARELDTDVDIDVPLMHDRVDVGAEPAPPHWK
ncbi:MAG: FAD-dependent oxidoreductase, partial [Pseudomonadota bacterium]